MKAQPTSENGVIAVIAEDEPLLRGEIHEMLTALWPELSIRADAADGLEALRALDAHRPQIMFLDIHMPGLSGLAVAEHASRSAHVVFITSFNEHAVAAFEQGAVDYLLKPLSRERMARTVERLKQRLHAPPADLGGLVSRLRDAIAASDRHLQWIIVQRAEEMQLITVGEICYFRSDSKYTTVATAQAEHLVSKPLKDLESELDPRTFWRIHRGVIVNINAIHTVHRGIGGHLDVRLKQRPETLPVSASYARLFKHL